jgi:hypothetical protein
MKHAVIDCISSHPGGCGNADVAEELGIRSDFERKQKDYPSYSILGLLIGEGRVRYSGFPKRYFVAE